MNKTPLSNRLHIGIFGRRNTGKSTLINAITGQDLAIVSDSPGTTTDPVYKAMEIHDVGPVVIIDTGGIDDFGKIGEMRVKKAYKILNKTDVALLVVERSQKLGEYERGFIKTVKAKGIPVLAVVNKSDEGPVENILLEELASLKLEYLCVSALNRDGIDALRSKIAALAPEDYERKTILRDMIFPGDLVFIVAPMDMEAPKGRLILPQVQTIRDILDSDCSVLTAKESEMEQALGLLKSPPRLIVTDSRVLKGVAEKVPADIPLTTFSILYARYKGDLGVLAAGIGHMDKLKPNDKVLIAEACTHHPIGDDIGRVIIPGWLKTLYPGIIVEYAAGYDFPSDVSGYSLVIHCGGCMLNRRAMMNRLGTAAKENVPVTNYGMVLARMYGLLDRVMNPFEQKGEMGYTCGR